MGSPEGFMCAECGKILSGPHADEEAGEAGKLTHKYKGHNYSGGLCEDCARKHRAKLLRHRGGKFLRLHHVEGVQ